MGSQYLSWGRVFRYEHQVTRPQWLTELHIPINKGQETRFLAHGLGRSYGDVCLNDDNVLVDMSALRRMVRFDPETGILECESGVSIADMIEVFLPRGWFPPVVPGTKFVTVGGAIANDIHGKNHHGAGTFGHHIRSLDLLRSDGHIYHCSLFENADLFKATIGGMGLTGLILKAELQLIPMRSAFFDVEIIKTRSVEEYFALVESSDQQFPYTVAWIDATAPAEQVGRGLFMRGRPMKGRKEDLLRYSAKRKPIMHLPGELPVGVINYQSCRLFNSLYYHRIKQASKITRQDFDNFFFPLDKIGHWNYAYGPKGFYQYQLVIPEAAKMQIKTILSYFGQSGFGSFLTVLKSFGDRRSLGLMSFPMHGPTLTLDIPNEGSRTLKFMENLDALVQGVGGRLYAAKDARMSPEFFRQAYPEHTIFEKWIDPKFSSSYWRRVNNG